MKNQNITKYEKKIMKLENQYVTLEEDITGWKIAFKWYNYKREFDKQRKSVGGCLPSYIYHEHVAIYPKDIVIVKIKIPKGSQVYISDGCCGYKCRANKAIVEELYSIRSVLRRHRPRIYDDLEIEPYKKFTGYVMPLYVRMYAYRSSSNVYNARPDKSSTMIPKTYSGIERYKKGAIFDIPNFYNEEDEQNLIKKLGRKSVIYARGSNKDITAALRNRRVCNTGFHFFREPAEAMNLAKTLINGGRI